MNTVTTNRPALPAAATIDYWALARKAAVVTWKDLPRALLSAAPLVGSLVLLLVFLPAGAITTVLLLALVSASFVALLVAANNLVLHRAPLRAGADPLSSAAIIAVFTAGLSLSSAGGAAAAAGYLLVALAGLIGPGVICYSVQQEARGLTALKAGAVLTATSPLAALSQVAVFALAGFVGAASAGVLLLVTMPFAAVFAALITRESTRRLRALITAHQ